MTKELDYSNNNITRRHTQKHTTQTTIMILDNGSKNINRGPKSDTYK